VTHTVKTHSAATHAAQQARKKEADMVLQARRKAAIKAVKAKQRQLGMDDATYRAMLQARTGKTSATQCSLTELGAVNNYLSAQGAVNPKSGARAGRKTPVPAAQHQALHAKVQALMGELAPLAGIANPSAYLDGICQRNAWCSSLHFADAHILHKLVGALATTLKAKTRAANTAPRT
jgi:phage gp16-like protein